MADSGDAARVIGAEVVGDHRLRLTFAPLVVGELDFKHQEWKEGAEALADSGYFASVSVDLLTGELVWPNGYRMRPGELYAQLQESLKPASHADGSKDPSLVTVAGAVASGLGVLGFIAFAGGVVLWSRFKEMGLAADHALGLVPKAELVATGAEFLVPALLLSSLIVAAIVVISRLIDALTHDWPPTKWLVAPILLGLTELGFAIALLVTTIPLWDFMLLAGVAGLGALVVSVCARSKFTVFGLVAFLAVGTFAIARTYERTSHRLEVLPMAYSRSQSGEAPRVEFGYFVVETSDRIIFASLPEGETSTDATTGANELREFPRTETDDLEIGELALPEQAEEHAARFAYNLCERLAHLRPAPTPSPGAPAAAKAASAHVSTAPLESSSAAKPEPVCTSDYVQELANKAGRPWLPAATECRTRLCVFGKVS